MSYLTILTVDTGEFRIKSSKFFAFVHPIKSLDEYKYSLQNYKAIHPKACHVCSAYRLYSNGQFDEYTSDDGEPRGSSGLPILNVIKRHNIINVAIYIVRYFGGIKLGIPGLINAYSASAEDALLDIPKVPWMPTMTVLIEHDYVDANIIEIALSKFQAKIINQDFGESIKTSIQIGEELKIKFDEFLSEASNGKLSIKR